MSKKTKGQRQDTVVALEEALSASPNLYLTDFTGLDVERMTDLRRRLRGAGVKYLVVKNTLIQRALAAKEISVLDEHLNGPTGVVFAGEDPISAAKVLADFVKEHERPTIKGGMLEGAAVTASEVARLASLPSRDQLLSQLAGTLQGPMAGFLGAMNGLLYQFAGAVEALRAQRSAESQ
jgi:large subunit ribosomal protein L10